MRRRSVLAALGAAFLPSPAWAVGEEGAFHARLLDAGVPESPSLQELDRSAASRFGWEVTERTSAPARTAIQRVQVESLSLLDEPFVIWSGRSDPGHLSPLGLRRLREFFSLGGLLLVDDREPSTGSFSRGVRRVLSEVLPESPIVPLTADHVIFKSFYLVERPMGRVLGPGEISAILEGGVVRAVLLEHDLLGALARRGETWAESVEPGGAQQRELAIRFAVNLAMFLLCTDYKDDQVHAPFLMRRRGGH